jgi:hypothetical protein
LLDWRTKHSAALTPHYRFAKRRDGMVKHQAMKELWLAAILLVCSNVGLFANGGAWQTDVPGTGSASATNKDRHTDVAIENETLKIDQHPECSAVEVRYRMHNTGPKVQQDFFFPARQFHRCL